MKRKLYLSFTFLLLIHIPLVSGAWISSRAQVGDSEANDYQSSNPVVSLKETRAINQGSSEECYLFAFVGALETANLNGWKRPNSPAISSEQMVINKFLAWADQTFRQQTGLDEGFYFHIGGDVYSAMKLSVDWGLFPQDLFSPRKPYLAWDFDTLYRDVRAIVREEKLKVARAKTDAEFNQFYSAAMKRLGGRLGQEAGDLPHQFQWKQKNWDTRSFSRQFGIKKNSNIFMMYPKNRWDMGEPWDLRRALYELIKTFEGTFRYRQSSWNQIWTYVIESIDQGMPVMLSMKWGTSYHVLDAVGYEYNNRNEIVSFKLKNSWGAEYGQNGHAFFDPEDLQKFVTSIWGFQSPKN